MKEFAEALLSTDRHPIIPEEDDIYAPLLGSWDLQWIDQDGQRVVKGEWIFSRVLDGTAVQDTFIVPSRTERLKNPQPDAEYGTTVRIYNPQTRKWDVFYGCSGSAIRMEGEKVGGRIVMTEVREGMMQWIFTDIMPSSFRWVKMLLRAGVWEMEAELKAERKPYTNRSTR